jgi:Protein of unknown function (DUF4012)
MSLTDDPGREAASPDRGLSTPLTRRPRRGAGQSSRRQRYLALRLLVLFLVAIAASAVIGDVSLVHARQVQASVTADLQTGANELLAGKQSVSDATSKSDATLLAAADQHFARSRSRFESALHQLQGDPVLVAARLTPGLSQAYVGPRLQAAISIAEMGIALDEAGSGAATIDAALLKPAAGNLHGGERLVQVLKTADPIVKQIVADLTRAQEQAKLIDASVIPGSQRATVAKAKAEIQKGLDGLNEFQRLSPALLDILGQSGARTYLVEQLDPAELRAGGGFIGSFALLSIDKGKITLQQGSDVGAIDFPYPTPDKKDYVRQPEPLDEFTGVGRGWVFGDSNFFPDFATSAKTGEALFLGQTGKKVDGVISIDPWAVASMLEITGPLDVPNWNVRIDAKTFANEVFLRQEAYATQVQNRKQFFPDVANLILGKLSTLPADQWPKLLSILNGSVTQHHLQVYFNAAATETEMDRMGWSGKQVKPADQETMLEVESNFGGTKANHFLTRSYNLQLTAAGGVLHHQLDITYKDATPPGFLGGRHYRCYLRFYYPANATNDSTPIHTSATKPSGEKLDGVKMLDGWFQINVDPRVGFGLYSVTVQWDTPLPAGAVNHSIYWQKQAGTLNDAITVTYKVGGKTFTAASDLTQDRVLTLTDSGVQVTDGSAGSAHLPTLG